MKLFYVIVPGFGGHWELAASEAHLRKKMGKSFGPTKVDQTIVIERPLDKEGILPWRIGPDKDWAAAGGSE